MNALTQKIRLTGPAGALEALLDLPPEGVAPRGTAVIAHPHPLFGGTMDNKVVQTLARAFVLSGWRAVRFNFRGVGASEGAYDEGRGELQDLLAVVAHSAPDGALALAGFSFGAFVTSHAVAALAARDPQAVVLVGTAASRFAVAPIAPELHERTLVLHGEADDTVPLADAMAWARPQVLPVTVVPGGGHFFHGQLPLLRSLVVRHLRAV
ncbi:MAG: alpha/beta hydrolase [Burkholderiaceae bacterium]|nr:alpha/beta hydrolase [Burkholderiaceae bacterium]